MDYEIAHAARAQQETRGACSQVDVVNKERNAWSLGAWANAQELQSEPLYEAAEVRPPVDHEMIIGLRGYPAVSSSECEDDSTGSFGSGSEDESDDGSDVDDESASDTLSVDGSLEVDENLASDKSDGSVESLESGGSSDDGPHSDNSSNSDDCLDSDECSNSDDCSNSGDCSDSEDGVVSDSSEDAYYGPCGCCDNLVDWNICSHDVNDYWLGDSFQVQTVHPDGNSGAQEDSVSSDVGNSDSGHSDAGCSDVGNGDANEFGNTDSGHDEAVNIDAVNSDANTHHSDVVNSDADTGHSEAVNSDANTEDQTGSREDEVESDICMLGAIQVITVVY